MAKILVIEDDMALQTAYEFVLSAEKYTVKTADNGQQGLEAVDDFKPDLILLDMHMPLMSGIEFLKLYSPKAHPETKVIVFSNIVTPEEVNRALALGAYEYLTKSSFTPKSMVEKLATILKNTAS